MRQNRTLTFIDVSKLRIHELHPVMSLEPDVRLRLMHIFDPSDRQRISRSAVLEKSEINPIHIISSLNKPKVVAGWSNMLAAKLLNIDEVLCVHEKKMNKSKVMRIVMNDFFLDLSLQRTDVISQRIRSIVLENHLEDKTVKDLLTIDFRTSRNFYEIPVLRKRDALLKVLKKSNECNSVQKFLLDDFDSKHQNKLESKTENNDFYF